jgi:hypothetical protein
MAPECNGELLDIPAYGSALRWCFQKPPIRQAATGAGGRRGGLAWGGGKRRMHAWAVPNST